MVTPEDIDIETALAEAVIDPDFVPIEAPPLVAVMGYTVQPKALEFPGGLYDTLLVTYEFKYLNDGSETWYPFMNDVRVDVPKRATDEEISATIAKDMIVREKNLHGVYPDDPEPGEEKEIDSPFGSIGIRITGGE